VGAARERKVATFWGKERGNSSQFPEFAKKKIIFSTLDLCREGRERDLRNNVGKELKNLERRPSNVP